MEVLHLAVRERQAALFVPFERRRVVRVQILLARCGEIPRYSIDLPSIQLDMDGTLSLPHLHVVQA